MKKYCMSRMYKFRTPEEDGLVFRPKQHMSIVALWIMRE